MKEDLPHQLQQWGLYINEHCLHLCQYHNLDITDSFSQNNFVQTPFILSYVIYDYITFTAFTTFRRINSIMTGNEMEGLVPRKHIPNRECRPKIFQSKIFVYSIILFNQYYQASKLNIRFLYSSRTIGSKSNYILDNFSFSVEVPNVDFFKLTEVFNPLNF